MISTFPNFIKIKKYVFVLFLCFFSLMTFAQSTNTTLKLDYLPEYPSEIDGACCGYYLSQEDLKNDKLLIADDFITAYMIINGKKEVLSIKQGSSKHEREFSNAPYPGRRFTYTEFSAVHFENLLRDEHKAIHRMTYSARSRRNGFIISRLSSNKEKNNPNQWK